MEEDGVDDDGSKRTKRPRKPRRSQLEDAYPPTIQVCSFLLSRQIVSLGKLLWITSSWGKESSGCVSRRTATIWRANTRPEGNNQWRSRTLLWSNRNVEEWLNWGTRILSVFSNFFIQVDILENVDLNEAINIDDMDFSDWMNDEDNGDFDDSLNG